MLWSLKPKTMPRYMTAAMMLMPTIMASGSLVLLYLRVC
jgi:hypothetical protein